MGSQELIMGSNEITQIIKGKRTKRQQRPMSPPPLPLGLVMSSTTSLSSSPSCSSVEFAEEEDMANCLILLAQGNSSNDKNQIRELPSEQETRATNTSKVYVYKCKTCNRCFPSFQALGGHRASHKKPKIAEDNQDKKAICTATNQEHQHQHQDRFQEMNTTLSLQIADRVNFCGNNMINMIKSNKIHECSICGAEFSSGQALGGHMRRHRAIVSNSTSANLKRSSPDHDQSQEYSTKKSRNSLQLDLNLPAPQEDDLHQDARLIRFTSSKEQVLVFTATPNLIDCHY